MRRSGQHSFFIKRQITFVWKISGADTAQCLLANLNYIAVSSDTYYSINLGQFRKHIILVALCKASGNYDSGDNTGFFVFGNLQYCFDSFCLCSLNKAAGIDYHNIGILYCINDFETGISQFSKQYLAVYLILWTAQRNHTYLITLIHLFRRFLICKMQL